MTWQSRTFPINCLPSRHHSTHQTTQFTPPHCTQLRPSYTWANYDWISWKGWNEKVCAGTSHRNYAKHVFLMKNPLFYELYWEQQCCTLSQWGMYALHIIFQIKLYNISSFNHYYITYVAINVKVILLVTRWKLKCQPKTLERMSSVFHQNLCM